ncbi:MAG TPA: hypothetical protein VE967_19720 [Gemmatimonadaceae bacterium]|nr:hypothetical protein [Gemmatimonadaceae bacterium]
MSGLVEDVLKATSGQIQLSSPLGVWMQLISRLADAGIIAAGGATPFGNSAMPVGVVGSGGNSFFASRADHVHAHGNLPGGTLHDLATPLVAGFMSALDKAQLDALVAGGPYVPVTRTLTAGAGMTGGGELSADRTFNIVAADGTIIVGADDIRVGVIADANHGNLSGGALHAIATNLVAGFMSAADKAALDSLVAFSVPNTRTLTAGAGLTGGGDLSADRTFNVGQNADGSVVVNANDVQVSAAIQSGAALGATSVQPARTLTAGAGLTGGGDLSANRTFDVGQNADGSVVVNADDVQVSAALQAGASTASFARIPQALVGTAVLSRSFRYVIPRSNGGLQDSLGLTTNALTGVTTVSPTNTDLRTSSPRNNTTTSTANILVGQNFTDPGMCRGAVAGVGGFFVCFRFAVAVIQTDSIISIGINNAVIAGGANPSASGNRVVYGADTGDANITVISTDNVGGSTKSAAIITKASLVTGDPNTAGPCVFEVQMWALPNDTKIHTTLINRSTNTVVHDADISATLPLNTTNLRPTCVQSSKGATNNQMDFIHMYGYW